MEYHFEKVIHSRERFRKIIGYPAPAIVVKVMDQIDEIYRSFIAASPFAVIAVIAPKVLSMLRRKAIRPNS